MTSIISSETAAPHDGVDVEWRTEPGLLDYDRAVAAMEARAEAVRAGTEQELIWFVEHPPLYTAGTSAQANHIALADPTLPLFRTGRGGELTYHGPGQRVVYIMLDLQRHGRDLRRFVARLEDWVIAALAELGVEGGRRAGRIGIWVDRPDKGPGHEDKIAAIGVRVRRWVTFHGLALNIAPDLARFQGIVPCGIEEARFGVTSLADLGLSVSMEAVDAALTQEFARTFR